MWDELFDVHRRVVATDEKHVGEPVVKMLDEVAYNLINLHCQLSRRCDKQGTYLKGFIDTQLQTNL